MRETFDPAAASRLRIFRDRYSMALALQPKQRAAAIGRACRAIVLPGSATSASEFRVLRACRSRTSSPPAPRRRHRQHHPRSGEDVIPGRALDVMHLLAGVKRH
jgi:hypothetical protein